MNILDFLKHAVFGQNISRIHYVEFEMSNSSVVRGTNNKIKRALNGRTLKAVYNTDPPPQPSIISLKPRYVLAIDLRVTTTKFKLIPY